MSKKANSPTGQQIKDFRKQHRNLTQQKLADSLYGVTVQSIQAWENGRRNCPPIVWWAMLLTWDDIDLWREGK